MKKENILILVLLCILIFCDQADAAGKQKGKGGAMKPTIKAGQVNTAKSRIIEPQMVLVPAGHYLMGSKNGEADEKPIHEVYIYSYYISKYEVTKAEFIIFVQITGYLTDAEKAKGAYVLKHKIWGIRRNANWNNPYFSQNDDEPVVCISWNDAVAYEI